MGEHIIIFFVLYINAWQKQHKPYIQGQCQWHNMVKDLVICCCVYVITVYGKSVQTDVKYIAHVTTISSSDRVGEEVVISLTRRKGWKAFKKTSRKWF